MANINEQFLQACQESQTLAHNILLVSADIDVNVTNSYGKTPLHFAVASNHNELITTLLERGANPNASDDAGNTPLHEAVRNSNPETIGLLLSAGASLELKNLEGQTPLNLAGVYDCITLSTATQTYCQHLGTRKQQGLANIQELRHAIAEQERFITYYEEMIRQQEQNLQRLQSRVQLTNAQTFEELQTLAQPVYLLTIAKKRKVVSASLSFNDASAKYSLIPQASKSAAAITSSQSTSQVTPTRKL